MRHGPSSPSPLVGECPGAGSGGCGARVPERTIPTPDPSPQGEGEQRAATRSIFAANRAQGRVSIGLAARAGVTRRTATREEGSLRVRFPGACASATEAVLINTAGGIAGGDGFAVDLDLETDARLVVTTAAAEKIYRSLGPDSRFDATVTLAEGAELLWLPQETILFDRARFTRNVDITLAPSATLLFAETVVFGRTAMRESVLEGHFTDRWRVRRCGRLIFAENFHLDGPIADRLNEAAIAGGNTAVGTVLMVPGDGATVAAVRAVTEQFRGEFGISAWNGIALARLAAADGAALRHDLVIVLSALGRSALPRIWLNSPWLN
jgi:urease accessory protein